MTTEKKDAIISKIKKLQRLVERAGTPEEAASAAARIQEMLFKYNLELATIEQTPDASSYGSEGILLEEGGGSTGGSKTGGFNIAWRRSLLHVVATNNFCTSVNSHKGIQAWIVGQAHNVEIVRYLYGYLAREIRALSLDAMRKHCRETLPGPQGAWTRAFCLGAVSTIGRRLRAQREQDTKATPSSTAMVLVTDAVLKDALARAFPKLMKGAPRARARSLDAVAHGRAAGEQIRLDRPLAGGQAQRQIR